MSGRTFITVSDVLNQAKPAKGPPLSGDHEVNAHCEKCGQWRLMSDCRIEGGAETTYTCNSCGSVLLVIGAPNADGKPWPGRGYRLDDFLLRNAVDLEFRQIRMKKSPNALETKPPQ